MTGRRLNQKGRNLGYTFVMLRHDIMDSRAYLALSPDARCVYQCIKRRFNGYNNGDIPISCREAAEQCNIGKSTAAKALIEIQEKGFAVVTVKSGFNVKGSRRSQRWRLTEEGYNGQPPTNDWRDWEPG